jgi:CheY-like chemotaxis protein
MLEDLGHTVIAAHSGEHALEIIRGGRAIDLMMTDHAMPGMTGVELARTTHDLRPKMPILLVTGYADLPSGQVLDLPRLGKPYQQTQLRTEIERLLAGAQSAA